MPIYEYRCEACGHELEVIRKMTDQPLVECPQCGASSLKKLLSAVGFRLKGSGWYETDFKADGRKNLHHGSEDSPKKEAAKVSGDKGTAAESKTTADSPASSSATETAK